jgi:hypothetical protein
LRYMQRPTEATLGVGSEELAKVGRPRGLGSSFRRINAR